MRKSISVSFFSTAALMLIVGIAVMGFSEMYLVGRYFAQEKYATLDTVLDVADVAIDRLEQTVQQQVALTTEQSDHLVENVDLISDTAAADLFYVSADGQVLLATSDGCLQQNTVSAAVLDKVADKQGQSYHALSKLDGMFAQRHYVAARLMRNSEGLPMGYLFVCTDSAGFSEFLGNMLSNFMLSASLMLLCASILSMLLTQRLTGPLHNISEAAKRFGGGDFSVRVEADGDDEVAQLAHNFNTMAANLEAIDSSRAQFMGNIAHELRTPMTTIKGFIDGMLDGTIPPELQNHYLQIVSQETGRLARLVQNMLDISKLESGEYRVNARLYNIWDTLTGAALSAEQRITEAGIEVEGLEDAGNTLVYADPDLIHQVVYNLLDNAIKFTPSGGVIRLSAVALGPEVEVSVWNSGQGIAPENLPFVFERFYKEDKSRGLNARGSGLGLHICKVLVRLAGGQIRVESQHGEWCRFVFTLPSELPNKKNLAQLADESGTFDHIVPPRS
ncbi:MAG: HAMP domain-containing histidine kinase [Faecalibacterium sp.]|nr:HAMP domain-containing histidine kinase [Faecalibacterium sp.]